MEDGSDLEIEVNMLTEECNSLTFIAEAHQALKIGFEFFAEAVARTENEAPGDKNRVTELGFEALDKFREASVLAREQDVETICKVRTAVGQVYYDLFKMPTNAKLIFKDRDGHR